METPYFYKNYIFVTLVFIGENMSRKFYLYLQTPKPTGGSLTGMFQKASGSWECDMCMVNNKASDEKCVACTNPKPKSAPANASAQQVNIS